MSFKKVFFVFVFVILVSLLFVSLEGMLRLFRLGYSTLPFEKPSFLPIYYRDNPLFSNKYYPSKKPSSRSDSFYHLFPVSKSPHTLRLVVLGGSTAQGFPYHPNHSFSKIIEKALAETGLYTNVEVINLGFSALSSYYVADVAPKLVRYQVDGIIIYSGQNEYYGTITSVAKPYWMQKLYLFLKEWRVFQLAFSLVESSRNTVSTSLMEKQFAHRKIPFSQKQDEKIARDFIRNIDTVVRFYKKHRIPVFVYEPVVNLIDMPPFSSENDTELHSFLLPHAFVYTNIPSLRTKLYSSPDFARFREKFPSNAHLLYLQAKIAQEEQKAFLDLFEAAKDRDTIPFRYRSPLREKLRSYAISQTNNPFFVFIPLRDEIIRRRGSNSFDNSLFVDHLHFNRAGQHLLAQLFCDYWLRFHGGDTNTFQKLSLFFSHPQKVEESIFYHPYYDFEALSRISGLKQNLPFSGMILPYFMTNWEKNHPFLLSTPPSLLRLYETTNDFVKLYIFYLYEKQKLSDIASLIETIRWLFPAHPQSHYNIALFLSTTNSYSEVAAQAWIVALLLSEKTNQHILSHARKYFHYHRQENKLRQWRITP